MIMITSFVSPLLSQPKTRPQSLLCPPRRTRSKPTLHPRHRVFPISVTTMSASTQTRGILMLCTGNICRSPAAEAVMKRVLDKRGLSHFFVDSCGTGGGSSNWYKENGFSYHEGDLADPRMRAAASQRGLNLESRSRPLTRDDFDNFEVIVAMDKHNLKAIETARRYWKVENPKAKIVLMSNFSPDESFQGKPIPDPYWSGADGFEYALDLIEAACEGLADDLTASA